MSNLTALQAQRGQLVDLIALKTAERDSQLRSASQAQSNIPFATTPQAKARLESQVSTGRANAAAAQQSIDRTQTELASVDQQIAAQKAQSTPPATSAGATAASQEPAATANAAPQPTNAFRSGTEEDDGTDAPTRTLSDTQVNPAPTAQPGPPSNQFLSGTQEDDAVTPGSVAAGGTAGGVTPTRTANARSPTDDNVQSNAVKDRINEVFGGQQPIVPQDNILDRFASYTYNISIYLMSPADYKKLLTTKQRNISGYQLLMRSGGAPNAGGSLRPVDPQEAQQAADGNSSAIDQPSLGRNQFFPLDYYIDELRLKSVISGKGTSGAHNVFEMSMRIIEPNGISLLDNLYLATQQYVSLQGGTREQNYAAQNFLMVIKFYGYDENGNAVTVDGRVKTKSSPDSFETGATVEKYIPFQFTNIKFKLTNKLTEYECSMVCPQNLMATGQARGIIPYNVELTGATLKEILTGNATFKTANTAADTNGREDPSKKSPPPPDKASAAPTATVTRGLVDALNKYQQEKVQKGEYAVADQYEIVLVDSVIQNAKMQPPVVPARPTNKNSVAMTDKNNAGQQTDPKKQSSDNSTKNTSIVAGTSIVRLLDQVLRNSTYVYEQMIKMPGKNPKTGAKEDVFLGPGAEALAWYRIGAEAEPLTYDPKRNDYAYKIKYQVSMYKVNGVKSDYFPENRYNGVHKKYAYWFTGQNTQVLKFDQDFNYLYFATINSGNRSNILEAGQREMTKYIYQTASNQSQQGQDDMVNEPGANAADYLYSPTDQGRVKLEIVGDPAWIQQGEIWSGLQGNKIYQSNFLPDGTINFENQEVLFELSFNKPVDYDLNTGVMDPGKNNYLANRAAGEAGQARQTYIYKAVQVDSVLSRGRFTQELTGALVLYPKKDTNADSSRTSTTAATPQPLAFKPSVAALNSVPTGVPMLNAQNTSSSPGFNLATTASLPKAQLGLGDIGSANKAIFPSAPAAAPTSGTETVGPANSPTTTNYNSGGVFQEPQETYVPFVQDGEPTGQGAYVSSTQEVQNLYNRGEIDATTKNAALSRLQSLDGSQQAPVSSQQQQSIRKDDGGG